MAKECPFNQAAKPVIPLDGNRMRRGGKGVLLKEEATSREILADPSGARLKSPIRTNECLSSRHSQSSPH